jgi:Arc/MetJ family transcription regulator
MMIATVDVEADLITNAMRGDGSETTRQVVEEALKTLARLRAQEKLRSLRGVGWIGDLDAMRTD